MKRNAIRVQATDGASHYLWLDPLTPAVFLSTASLLLRDTLTSEAATKDVTNNGFWLWHHVHAAFHAAHGGRTSGLMTAYFLPTDVECFPLLALNAVGVCWLEDSNGDQLTTPMPFHEMGDAIHAVLTEEPAANFGVVYAYLDVDEEI